MQTLNKKEGLNDMTLEDNNNFKRCFEHINMQDIKKV